MTARPNLLNIIQRAAKKAEERQANGCIPCFADRLASTLAELPAAEIEATLKDWVSAAGRPDATPFIRMRSEVAFNLLKEVKP